MYTFQKKYALVFQQDAPANQPPEAIKAIANDVIKKLSNSDLKNLSDSEREELQKYFIEYIEKFKTPDAIFSDYTAAKNRVSTGKATQEDKMIVAFYENRAEFEEKMREYRQTVGNTSQNIETPTLSEEIKQATATYQSELESAKQQIEQKLKSPLIASFNIQNTPLYTQYNNQYIALISSLSKLQDSSRNINQTTLLSLQNEVKRFKEDTETVKKKYGSYNGDIRSIASFVEKQSSTYIAVLDTEIKQFGTESKPSVTRGSSSHVQAPIVLESISKDTPRTGEIEKQISQYHSNFKTMWREFNRILDPVLRDDPEKGFAETYEKAQAQYYALEKVLATTQNESQIKQSMPEVIMFVALLRQFETKDTRVKPILDTFEQQTNSLSVFVASGKKAPQTTNTPTNTTPESAETQQTDYLDRIEADIKSRIKEAHESSGTDFQKKWNSIFEVMIVGANLTINERYISAENKEALRKYQPTLQAMIGEMLIDILKEDGYTIRFVANDKKVKGIVCKHSDPEKAKAMTKIINSKISLGYTHNQQNHPLYKALRAGAIYDVLDTQDMQTIDWSQQENIDQYLGTYFQKGTINTKQIQTVVQSMDKKDELEQEMQKTVRALEQSIAGGSGGSTGTNWTNTTQSSSTGNNPIAEALNPLIGSTLDAAGFGFRGFVQTIHDIHAAEKKEGFMRGTLTGLALFGLMIFALKKLRWWAVPLFLGIGFAAKGTGLVDGNDTPANSPTSSTPNTNNGGKVSANSVSQTTSSAESQKTAPTNTLDLLATITTLSLAERTKLEKELIKPLSQVPIIELQQALESNSDEDWDKVYNYISDETIKEKIKKSLQDNTQKSALKVFVQKIIDNEDIKKFKNDNPAKYQTLTLEAAQNIIFDANKLTVAEGKSNKQKKETAGIHSESIDEYKEGDIFTTVMKWEDGKAWIFGPDGEEKEMTYEQVDPKVREKFESDFAKIDRYRIVFSTLLKGERYNTFAKNLQDAYDGKQSTTDMFANLDRELNNLAGVDVDISVKEYLENPTTKNTAEAYNWLKEEDKGGNAYDVIGDQMANMLIAENTNLQSEYEKNETAILQHPTNSVSVLNLDSDQKEDIQEEIDKMNKLLSSGDYKQSILTQIRQSIGIGEDATLTAEENADLAGLVEDAIKDSRNLGIQQILKHSMVYNAIDDDKISSPIADVYSEMKGIGWFEMDDRNEGWAGFIAETIAWEVAAIVAGAFTAGVGAAAIHAIKFSKTAKTLYRLMGTGRFARFTRGTVEGAAVWGAGFGVGYKGVQGIKSKFADGGTFMEGFGGTSEWATMIAFGAAGGMLREVYKIINATKLGQATSGGAKVLTRGIKIFTAGMTFGGVEIAQNVMLGEGVWDEDSLQKVVMMTLLHGAAMKTWDTKVYRTGKTLMFGRNTATGTVTMSKLNPLFYAKKLTDYFGFTGSKYSSNGYFNVLSGLTIGDLGKALGTRPLVVKEIAKVLAFRGIPLIDNLITGEAPDDTEYMILLCGYGRGIFYEAAKSMFDSGREFTSQNDFLSTLLETVGDMI